ncbi:MAG: division/cell wall cluster transcriptional repressor MraZ [Solobacterium sp.]|nr:division/cell wall cluster transcriptional repressor MraZ [Erysipelotrichaceae bacterium]MBQ9152795.1 division/cell wall cluster transcriptional repressor MraZ [Solobacterium sp.]
MFMGEYRHSLDAKNRLIIPAKFRDELGSTFVVTKGLDGCLTVYTEEQWTALVHQLEQLPTTKREVRQYVRFLLSKAVECQFDSQGRIQLPQVLVDAAQIDKKCTVIGAADHIEIWSDEKWDAYESEAGESFESVAESLTEFLR